MRKFRYIIFLLFAAVCAAAQDHLCERVYVSTDRDVYVAGDELFLSAFCIDMGTGKMSDCSRIAYIEICSPEGPVQTAKIALEGGRGGGFLLLDNTIPTGQYKLVAYTAQCFNEDGYDFEEGGRLLSIINPFTDARSPAGVEILSDEAYEELERPVPEASGSVRLEVDDALVLTNTSDRPVTLSLSLRHDDGMAAPQAACPAAFLDGATKGTAFTRCRTIDLEGEVVHTRVQTEGENLSGIAGGAAFLSVPGRSSDFYVSRIGPDGSADFYTRNIRGGTDVVLDVASSAADCHLEVISPFAAVKASGLPRLPLSPGLAGRITSRSIAMQMHRAAGADSLYLRPPSPEDYLFAADSIEYRLDDYTRFPLMEELFVEFITQVRIVRNRSGLDLVVSLEDTFRPAASSSIPALVLLDGVPVPDHKSIFDYDPLLVERIVVYPHSVYLGGWIFGGVVSFVTYKHDLASFRFGDNTRIVRFQGVSSPVCVRDSDAWAGIPNLRRTLLWYPVVELAPGETRKIEYAAPSYSGTFEAVAEGFDSDGKPQYARMRTELPAQ